MMLRSRSIRPGIATNVELGKLGTMAEVLFTRLWMLADREGRLEDDAEKIKVKGLANYPVYTIEAVENLLKSLHDCGLIMRYKVPNGRGTPPNSFISIPTFKIHQRFHPREEKSVIPPPPGNARAQRTEKAHPGKTRDEPRTNLGQTQVAPRCPLSSLSSLSSSSAFGGEERARAVLYSDSPVPEGNSPPLSAPVKPPVTEPPKPQPPKPPGQLPPAPKPKPPDPKPTPPPRTGYTEHKPARAVPDMWPHDDGTVSYVRESLRALAEVLHMPEPDDWILRQVLDAGKGAPAERIHAVIRGLYQQRRFENIRSWGLLPVVVAPWFRSARAG
jgi:hypothetical protein